MWWIFSVQDRLVPEEYNGCHGWDLLTGEGGVTQERREGGREGYGERGKGNGEQWTTVIVHVHGGLESHLRQPIFL